MLINIPAKIQGNDPVPAGIYKGLISSTTLKHNESTGNSSTSIEITLTSQGPDESVKTIGRKTFDTLTWNDAALPVANTKVKQICGREIPQIVEPGELSVEMLHMAVSNAILNHEVMIQLTCDPVKRKDDATGQYVVVEGEFRNNVKKYQQCEG